MGKCTDGDCSITKSNTCCFECSAARLEECMGIECTCEAIENGEVDRNNYIHCPHYNN